MALISAAMVALRTVTTDVLIIETDNPVDKLFSDNNYKPGAAIYVLFLT
jgi:hypothetical protein